MSYKVGTKGQVVIAEEIREALGVEPGWLATQNLVGDHVEIRFFPPEHERSLLGSLSGVVKRSVSAEEWPAARERAWVEGTVQSRARNRPKAGSNRKSTKKRTDRG